MPIPFGKKRSLEILNGEPAIINLIFSASERINKQDFIFFEVPMMRKRGF